MDIRSTTDGTMAAVRYARPDAFVGMAGRLKPGAPEEELHQVAQQFEGFFLSLLMKEMRKTVQKTGLFSGGKGEEVFTDLLDEKVAESAVQRGQGLGIGEMIVRQYRRQVAAADAGGAAGAPGGEPAPNQSPPGHGTGQARKGFEVKG